MSHHSLTLQGDSRVSASDVDQQRPTVRFSSLDRLHDWLIDRGIPCDSWRAADCKGIFDLWMETINGESSLHHDSPYRSLHVTQVIVRRGDLILIESEQEFKRGGRRRRERPPSEKMHRGETVFDASLRCLAEELGIEAERVKIQHDTYQQSSMVGNPQSYPGLSTRWHFHRIDAEVVGLPAGDFTTEEATTNSIDAIARHFWTWRSEKLLSQ